MLLTNNILFDLSFSLINNMFYISVNVLNIYSIMFNIITEMNIEKFLYNVLLMFCC